MNDLATNHLAVLRNELASLRIKLTAAEHELAEAQQIISAIRSGEVDAVVVSGPEGDQIFTLQGAEHAYRALVEEMSEGAATLGVDGTVLYCNQRLADLMQIPMEHIIGGPVAELFSKDSSSLIEALFSQAQEGLPHSAELELRAGDGHAAPVYVSLRAMTSLEPITICMVVTDLKERKRNDQLLAAGKLATSILESAAEAIAVCDQEGFIIKANEAFEQLCGSNPVWQPFEKVMPVQLIDDPARSFSIAAALQGDVIRALEVTFPKEESKPISLLLSASPIRDGAAVIGCVLTATDITERKRAQAAVLRSEKLASVGRMASTIAHEINNPLEIIGQSVYLAKIQPSLPEEAKSFLDLATAELERVAHITKQTLAFHKESSTATEVDLREVTDDVLKFFNPRLMVRGVIVEKRYGEVEKINGFAGELRQIVSNLLSNSMDAIDTRGRIWLRIHPTSRRDGRQGVRFVIADSGSGIRPEAMKTIFEPFFTTKEVIGTGLGLWVTRQIAEKHGATIRVRSKIGSGTVFSIDFPAASVPMAASTVEQDTRAYEETNSCG